MLSHIVAVLIWTPTCFAVVLVEITMMIQMRTSISVQIEPQNIMYCIMQSRELTNYTLCLLFNSVIANILFF